MDDQSKQLNTSKVITRLVVLMLLLIMINLVLKGYSYEITSGFSAITGLVSGVAAYLSIRC